MDEEVSTLADQPKEAKQQTGKLFLNLTAPVVPANVSKRKGTEDASEGASEYLPAQPNKRRNVTSEDSNTAFAPAMAPHKAARETKDIDSCEFQVTET